MTVDTVQVPKPNPRPPGAEDRVARRVEYERGRRKWSREELARQMTDAGVPINQSAIYKIERGGPRRTISLDEAHAFVRVFGLRDIEHLESIPEDVISDEVADYISRLERIEEATVALRAAILDVLSRAAITAETAMPLLAYVGSDPPWTRVGELEEQLTILADLIIKVRDDIGRLRWSPGGNP